jgi:glycosyltransferase involved in cell wall biosynthesis
MAISLLPPPPVRALARDPAAEVRGVTDRPLLTISVPTYQRVDLLERCLASIVPAEASTAGRIELVVSDNSPDSDAEELVERFASSWRSPVRYYRNPPGTGAVRNFNYCIERARGLYNLILHDDDYLLPGAIDGIVHTLQVVDQARDKVLLFGVDVVDLSGNVIRHQRFPQDQFLDPQAALRRLLGNSSFVRLPGLVVQSATYQGIGGFRVSAHTTCDFDIEIRLFSQFGVRCLQQVAAAYTIHPGGITTTVFTPRTIALSLQNFDTARRTGVLDPAAVDRLQRHWFHQFILAGTWRALKERDWITARRVYALFDLPEIRAQGISGRWLPVRAAFAVLSGALWRRGSRLSTATNGSSDRTGSTAAAQPEANAKGRHGTGTAVTREW